MPKKVTSLDGIYLPMHRRGSAPFGGILELDRHVALYQVSCDAPFQRDHVWTPEQQSKFVGHLLEGGDVAPLIVNRGPDGDWETTLMVDGKQRLTACRRWAESGIPALLYDGRRVWARHLDEVSQRHCRLRIGLEFALVDWSEEEMLANYIRLNRGGTVHTDQEIRKVQRMLQQLRREKS